VALIGAQVVLGAITVFAHNAGWTVALHLAGAWLLLAAVTVTAVRVLHPAEPSGAATLAQGFSPGRAPALAAMAGVFLLSVSGMLVLHDGASRACASWPLCLGSPAALRLLVLQYAHRILAFGATVAVAWAVVALWRSTPARSLQRLALGWVLALLAATVALGGIVATSGAPPPAQDLHLAAASASGSAWSSSRFFLDTHRHQCPARQHRTNCPARAGALDLPGSPAADRRRGPGLQRPAGAHRPVHRPPQRGPCRAAGGRRRARLCSDAALGAGGRRDEDDRPADTATPGQLVSGCDPPACVSIAAKARWVTVMMRAGPALTARLPGWSPRRCRRCSLRAGWESWVL
jgi:hypothetical protein